MALESLGWAKTTAGLTGPEVGQTAVSSDAEHIDSISIVSIQPKKKELYVTRTYFHPSTLHLASKIF